MLTSWADHQGCLAFQATRSGLGYHPRCLLLLTNSFHLNGDVMLATQQPAVIRHSAQVNIDSLRTLRQVRRSVCSWTAPRRSPGPASRLPVRHEFKLLSLGDLHRELTPCRSGRNHKMFAPIFRGKRATMSMT